MLFGLPFPTYLVWFIVPGMIAVAASICWHFYKKVDAEEKARTAAEKAKRGKE